MLKVSEYRDKKVVRKWLYPELKETETKQNASGKTLDRVHTSPEKFENAAFISTVTSALYAPPTIPHYFFTKTKVFENALETEGI